MTTPTTPAACYAEQERVLALLEGITPGEWSTSRPDLDSYACNPETDALEHVVYVYREPQERIGVFAGELDNARQDAALIAAAPTLARQYAALLGAYAEALAREARVLAHFQAAHDALQRRAEEGRIDFKIAARVVDARLEAARRNLPPPPAQAPAAGGEG